MKRHPWAIGLMDSRRTPGPETLRHHDAVLGCLRAAGFSLALTGHAAALLDAHLYGFVVQELALPFQGEGELAELGAGDPGRPAGGGAAPLPGVRGRPRAAARATPSATSSTGASTCSSTASKPTWPSRPRRDDEPPRLRRRGRPERRPRSRRAAGRRGGRPPARLGRRGRGDRRRHRRDDRRVPRGRGRRRDRLGLLPGGDRREGNPHLTLSLPTGLGELRNALLVRSADALVAVGGSWGTLSEVALACRTGVPVFALHGWDLPVDGGPVVVADPAEAVARVLEVLAG